jgi:hypothetical protein
VNLAVGGFGVGFIRRLWWLFVLTGTGSAFRFWVLVSVRTESSARVLNARREAV